MSRGSATGGACTRRGEAFGRRRPPAVGEAVGAPWSAGAVGFRPRRRADCWCGGSDEALLLTVVLSRPTFEAVNDREPYTLAPFALRAALGLQLFVKVLQTAFRRHRSLTLTLITGLMAGSLLALWLGKEPGLLVPDGGAADNGPRCRRRARGAGPSGRSVPTTASG
ncbi:MULTISPECIES: undecaprenyl phosphate translocase family protein [unclassified Modestobacter]